MTKKKLTRKQQLRRKKKIRRNLWRCLLSILTLIALVLVAALSAGFVAFKGPSQSVGDLLTVSMLETSALKFVPRIYYSADEIAAIQARNSVEDTDAQTDTSMIRIPTPTPVPTPTPEPRADETPAPQVTQEPVEETPDIELKEVKGSTYFGYMLIVHDPSRVSVGVSREKFSSAAGKELYKIAESYNAVAAINGGGFEDDGGHGNGGMPIGLVISDGVVRHTGNGTPSHNIVVGFNQDNVLVVGKMSSKEAQSKGLRDALMFGPALVINGEAVAVKGASSGLNPRTAIGQRADGAVLMLVIDGRQANSLGATLADLIEIMLEYGAVNAVNLDGGSSSMLYYNGEYVNNGVSLTGSRRLPTAFIVR